MRRIATGKSNRKLMAFPALPGTAILVVWIAGFELLQALATGKQPPSVPGDSHAKQHTMLNLTDGTLFLNRYAKVYSIASWTYRLQSGSYLSLLNPLIP